jgi:hypothetical protein
MKAPYPRRKTGSSGRGLLCCATHFLSLAIATSSLAVDRFVSLGGTHEYPFTTWAKAANTVQSAIVAAAPGDTIWVDAGTYSGNGNRNIDLLGKTLTLSSVYGSGVTFLECGGEAGLILNGTGIVVRGFTIEGAYSNGLRCAAGSQSLVENCHIRNCRSATNTTQTSVTQAYDGDGRLVYRTIEITWPDLSSGGGVYCVDAKVELRNCTLEANASSGAGGSLFSTNCQIKLADCRILESHSLVPTAQSSVEDYAYDQDGNLVISRCNTNRLFAQADGGGGLFLSASSLDASNCLLMGNSSALQGGALSLVAGSTGRFVQCQFIQNKAMGRFISDSVTIANGYDGDGQLVYTHVVSGATNESELAGGGVFSSASNLRLEQCLISDNTAEGDGGGLALAEGGTCVLSNSLVRGNRAGVHGYNLTTINKAYDGDGNLVFSQRVFQVENAGSGGALAVDASRLYVFGANLSANAAGSGGGISLQNNAALEMHETRLAQNTSLVERVQRITETTFSVAEESSEIYGEASALMLAASTATIARTLFDRNEGGATGALIQAVSASAIAMSNSVMRQNGAGRWRISTSSLASGYTTNAGLIHLHASQLNGMNCSLIFNEPATNRLVGEEGAQFAWVNSIVQSYGTAPDIALAFSMSHCCLVDPQFSGPGLLFANPALREDGRLTAGSPCIDAGTASGAPTIDLDGEARWDDPAHPNLSSIVDIGTDEWMDMDSDSLADFWESENYGSTGIVQGVEDDDHDGLAVLGEYEWGTNPFLPDSDGDWMPDGWEVENGLPALTGNGQDDADDDSFSNVDEFVALTDPQDYLSYFRVEKIVPASGAGASIEWLGRSNRIYGVWQSDDLATWSNVYQVAGFESVLSFTNADSEAGAQHNRVTVVRP